MNAHDKTRVELGELVHDLTTDSLPVSPTKREIGAQVDIAIDAILAVGYRKPRTIEHQHDDDGPDELLPLSVVLSGGKPAIRQYDHTFMDWDGCSWDDWEMEYPLTVIYEPDPS